MERVDADVFISYSRQDQDRVLAFAERLRAANVSVWIDQGGIDAAFQWSREIVQAIEGAKVFVLVASRTSFASENVVKEVALASESGKHILPVYLEPLTPPATMRYQLAGIQHVELFGEKEEQAFDSILRALGRLLENGGELVARPDPRAAARRRKRRVIGGLALATVLVGGAYGTQKLVRAGDDSGSIRLEVPGGIELQELRMELWELEAEGVDERLLTQVSLAAGDEAAVLDERSWANGVGGEDGVRAGAPGTALAGRPLEARLFDADERLCASLRFQVAEDGRFDEVLDTSPSLLVRVPVAWRDRREPGKVVLLRSGGATLAELDLEGAEAVLFGRSKAGIGHLRAEWAKERAVKKASDDERVRKAILDAWMAPVFQRPSESIAVGDTLEALFFVPDPSTGEDKLVARKEFEVGAQLLQDHLMRSE